MANRRPHPVRYIVSLAALSFAVAEVSVSASQPLPDESAESTQVVTGNSLSDSAVIDPGSLTLPSFNFTNSEQLAKDFHKYFYFYRSGVSFNEALFDIMECDAFGRGLNLDSFAAAVSGPGRTSIAHANNAFSGSIVGSLLFGSSERRRTYRVTMRRCMNYKGYSRFGLPNEIWLQINSEDMSGGIPEDERRRLFALQALAAGGPVPLTENLGL